MKKVAMFTLGLVMGLGSFAAGATSRQTIRFCTWGGTPVAPTGVVTIERGLTLTPSATDTDFLATGPLAGGGRCSGTMTFDGIIRAGSTCTTAWFEGKVKGLRGVSRFEGPGVLAMVHEFLYDRHGNIVGADQPLLQVPQPEGYSHAQDCATPEGFSRAVFSATVELFE